MVHLRIDNNPGNDRRVFACGVSPLPEGDRYVFEAEYGLHNMIDCAGCLGRAQQLGTPISQLSGRPGELGYEEFKRIARSWGYE